MLTLMTAGRSSSTPRRYPARRSSAYRFQFLSLDLLHCVYLATEEAGAAGLKIMHGSGNARYSSFSVSVKPDSSVEIGDRIEGGDPVQQVPAFDAVHAAKYYIALCNGEYRLPCRQIER